jgi:hypothetical protein
MPGNLFTAGWFPIKSTPVLIRFDLFFKHMKVMRVINAFFVLGPRGPVLAIPGISSVNSNDVLI